ncbi:MAG TPA: bifunctional riboflavin kinase/FAD synthetase [Capsulimonadaceae bacterium]|jgi:riboflavin kinase/FMN adenylyltransferase
MRVYTSFDNLNIERACVGIGVFDGFHRGHQQVMRAAATAASAIDGLCVALTFDRHPAELLLPQKAPLAIATLSQKIEFIATLGVVDVMVMTPFDLAFANMTPAQFVERVLVGKLNAKEVRVGADFRYGKDRSGSVMDLEVAGESYGFNVDIVHPITEGGERISSTRVRNLVAAGDVETARRLLGRPFTLRGVVGHGKKLGRTIGFPTANLIPSQPRQLLPEKGVYAGWAIPHNQLGGISPVSSFYPNSVAGLPVPAALSVGTNPTTDGENDQIKIEAYLMDGFDSDIYDQPIDLQFVERLRGEVNFPSLDALVAQMRQDCALATDILRADK